MSLRDEFLKMQGEADKTVRRTEREIVRSYKDALDDLYNTLGRLFRKYEIDGKLTYDEMVKYGRVGKLNKKLAVTAATLYKDVSREIKGGLKGIYEIGFDKTGSILSRETGKSLTGIIRQDVLDRALTNDISGLKWTERMGLHRDHVVMKIRETVTQGLHDGATYKQMADRLNKALSGDVVNPMRVVRTEGHRVFSQAQKDRLDEAYKSGTKMTKTWISSKDERVRDMHAEMEGVTVPYEEDFVLPDGVEGFAPGIIGAPQHDINCRCTWKIDIVDDEEDSGRDEGEHGIIKEKHPIVRVLSRRADRRYPTSQDQIDGITKNVLGGVRFSCKVLYNSRIRSAGKMTAKELHGRVWIEKIEIGKQYKDGVKELIDTILHEELEARIVKRAFNEGSERYMKMFRAGDSAIHPYINKVIARYLGMKGV